MNDIYYGPGSGCKDQIIWVVQLHGGSIFLGWWDTSWPIALAFQYFCRCSRRNSPVIWSSHVCVQGNIGPRTNYKNLLDQKYTRENYGTEHKTVLLRVFKKKSEDKLNLAHPGNRTPVSTVGGYYDTTTPDALLCWWWLYNASWFFWTSYSFRSSTEIRSGKFFWTNHTR